MDLVGTADGSSADEKKGEYLPATFVIGAVSHDDPVQEAKYGGSYVEENVAISNFSLSAACCCAKLCEAFEERWNVL
jgi:rRNA small subunit pseudouridine methyltransferase Nep1